MQSNICPFNKDNLMLISNYLTFQEVNKSVSLTCKGWHHIVESPDFWECQIKALDKRTLKQINSNTTVRQLKDHFINYVLPRHYILKGLMSTDEICVGVGGWLSNARVVCNLAFRTFCSEIVVFTSRENTPLLWGEASMTYSLELWDIQKKKLIQQLPMDYDSPLESAPELIMTESKKQEVLVSYFKKTIRSFWLPNSKQATISFEDCNPEDQGWLYDSNLNPNGLDHFNNHRACSSIVRKIFSFKPGTFVATLGIPYGSPPTFWVLLCDLNSKQRTIKYWPFFHTASNESFISAKPNQYTAQQFYPLLEQKTTLLLSNLVSKVSRISGEIQATIIKEKLKEVRLTGHPGKIIKKVITKDLNGLQMAVSIAKGDKTIKVWLLQGDKIESSMQELEHMDVRDIAFCQNLLVSVSYETGLIKIWDIYTGGCLKEIETNKEITAFCVHPSKMKLAWGTIGGEVYIHYLNVKEV